MAPSYLSPHLSSTLVLLFLITLPGQLTLTLYAQRQSALQSIRQFHNAHPHFKAQLYKSFILPVLEYCSSVWDPNLVTHIKRLESVQHFASRVVTGWWKDSYDSLLDHLNWSRLSQRRRRQKVQLCHRIVNGMSIIPPLFYSSSFSSTQT